MTGGSGFLGSWICRILARDHEVIAVIRESSSSYRLSNINKMEIIRANPKEWPDLISQLTPAALILADWWGVASEERDNPLQFDNIDRMANLFASARDVGVSVVIGVGSQAELGPVAREILESQPDGPTTEYGRAKVEARKCLVDLARTSNVRLAWLRIFSTYGPLDEGRWLIPSMVESLARGDSFDLTSGEQEWSYLHAFDLALAFKFAIENSEISGIINVGNPTTISIRKVAEIISEYFHAPHLICFGAAPYRSDQVMRLQPICESLIASGWRPQVDFKNGIIETIDWLLKKPEKPLQLRGFVSQIFSLPIRN